MNDVKRNVFVDSKVSLTIEEGLLKAESGDKVTSLCLGEIQTLFLESQASRISVKVLLACAERGIPVILCNEKHQPSAQFLPLSASFSSSGSLFRQIGWRKDKKSALAKRLLKNKLSMQARYLSLSGKGALPILLEESDPFSIEGPAAKAYFHVLFGSSFSRQEESVINGKLNYGYSIFASAISAEIVSHGYSPQLGIHHHSETNPFNLTYDFIEPFRPVVDLYVFRSAEAEFDFPFKTKFAASIVSQELKYGDRQFCIRDAITEFVQDSLSYLSEGGRNPLEVSL